MAKLIPPKLSPQAKNKSRAEVKLFDAFEKSASKDDVVVLHSVDFIEHEKKILGGECDFVVVCKGGVFVIEVKGGGVGMDDSGQWYTQNREGKHKLKESPIQQAKDAIGPIKRFINEQIKLDRPSQVVYGWAVAFPDVAKPRDIKSQFGPAVSESNVFFVDDLSKDIQSFVNRLSEYFSEKSTLKTRGLSRSEINNISKILRGAFFLDVAPRYNLSLVEDFQLHETDQQYRTRKMLLDGDSLVTGNAGTGKTAIAVKFAVDESRKGKRVGLVCFNRKLKDHLNDQLKSLSLNDGSAQAMTIHTFLNRIIEGVGLCKPKFNDRLEAYCDKAFEAISMGASIDFDRIIFDEGQDYLAEDFLEILELLREEGAEFQTSWFLDPMAQAAVFGNLERGALDRLRLASGDNYQRLTVNCRNTNEIQLAVSTILDDELKELCEANGPDVNWIPVKSNNCYSSLCRAINEFQSKGLKSSDIVVVSLRSLGKTGIAKYLSSQNGLDFFLHEGSKIAVHTASSFKGLESPGVIVIDVFSDLDHTNDWVRSVLYVAMTRAKYMCSVITDEAFNNNRIDRIFS